MEKNIITSIYIYDYNLFIAHLNRVIKIVKIPHQPSAYFLHSESSSYEKTIKTSGIIRYMQAKGHVLFTATSENFFAYDLKKKESHLESDFFSKEIPNCIRLTIDYETNYLFAVSRDRGIVVININDPRKPKFQGYLMPKIEKNFGDLAVTDIDVHGGKLFLAIRNYGILRADYKATEFSEPKIFREINKISLVAPQAVRYSARNNYLYIADAYEGLIVIDISIPSIIFQQKLPNDDFPQQIETFYNDAIIKSKQRCYYYHNRLKKLVDLFNFKIGTFTTYYNQIFFSKAGDIKYTEIGGKFRGGEILPDSLPIENMKIL